MDRIDKTKENIRVTNLDEKTRKKLFNKFTDAGGEVIKEKRNGNFLEFDREIQRQFKYHVEKQYKQPDTFKLKKKQKKALEKKLIKNIPIKTEAKRERKRKVGRIGLFFDRISIKWRLYLMGVTDLYGQYITSKFMNNFDTEYKNSLIEIQMIFIDLFKQNKRTSGRIIRQLDKFDPIYYELIELLSDVFNRTAIVRVLEQYLKYPDILIKAEIIKDPLMKIFKKLSPLNPYKEYLLFGLEKSIELQFKYDKRKSTSYSNKRKKIRNNLYIIFNKLYPRLYWLLCLYEGRIIQSDELEEIISVSSDDKPGHRERPIMPTGHELPPIDYEMDNENFLETEDEIPDEVKRGLKIINRLNIKKLRQFYDKKGLFKHVKDSDKILIIYLLFLEFDNEYSFILTTNKIKYNIISNSSEKLDYKARLTNIYNKLDKCLDHFKEYANILRVYEKVSLEKPISNTQFIEYSNRLTALNKERVQIGRETRTHVIEFLEPLIDDLKDIIDDIQSHRHIVANPDDYLEFDVEIEGEKKLNNRNISEAFVITYSYLKALLHRLSPEGDLSGDIEFKDKHSNDAYPDSQNGNRPNDNDEDDIPLKSIIEELDDFI